MKRNGFTLIELLVVVAIVAILAAILFPIYVTARGKAHQAACYSGLRQIGIAYMTYSQDWNDGLPYLYDWSSDPPRFIRDYLNPYIKANKQWRCPGQAGPALAMYYRALITQHYVANAGSEDRDPVFYSDPPKVRKLSQIKAPARTMAIFDWHTPTVAFGGSITWEDWYYLCYNPYRWKAPEVHNGGTNILWADGHVRWMKASAVRHRDFTTADD